MRALEVPLNKEFDREEDCVKAIEFDGEEILELLPVQGINSLLTQNNIAHVN